MSVTKNVKENIRELQAVAEQVDPEQLEQAADACMQVKRIFSAAWGEAEIW